MIARKQVETTSNQVSENALKLQRSLRQLEAARDVAKLEWEVAKGDLEVVTAHAQTGTSNPKRATRRPTGRSRTSRPPIWMLTSN